MGKSSKLDIVIEELLEFYRLDTKTIMMPGRDTFIVVYRHIFHYLCRGFTNSTLAEIGAKSGGELEHSTVLNSIKRMHEYRDTNDFAWRMCERGKDFLTSKGYVFIEENLINREHRFADEKRINTIKDIHRLFYFDEFMLKQLFDNSFEYNDRNTLSSNIRRLISRNLVERVSRTKYKLSKKALKYVA